VRDTSRKNFLLRPVQSLKSLVSKPSADPLQGIVLQPTTQQRLQEITLATSRTRQHGANFRHVMLYVYQPPSPWRAALPAYTLPAPHIVDLLQWLTSPR